MLLKPLHWAGVAIAAGLVGFVGYFVSKKPSTASKDPDGLEPAKADPPKSDETVIGPSESAMLDENGVHWSLYRYNDGRWEGNPLDADPKYVRVFNEAGKAEVKALIEAHAAAYNANGTIKTPTGPLPYVSGAKCADGYACWVLVDPTTAVPMSSFATTSPLKAGDVVTFYLGDEVDAKICTRLAQVTAVVTGPVISTPSNAYGMYPIKVTSSVILSGNPPMLPPAVGLQTEQWRFRMVAASLVA